MTLPLNWRRPWRELDDQELALRVSQGETSNAIAAGMHRTKFAFKPAPTNSRSVCRNQSDLGAISLCRQSLARE